MSSSWVKASRTTVVLEIWTWVSVWQVWRRRRPVCGPRRHRQRYNWSFMLVQKDISELHIILFSGSIRLTLKKSQDNPKENVEIEMENPVSLTFALKYLIQFAKATPLSPSVRFCTSNNHPLCVVYIMSDTGYIRYHLAPKMRRKMMWTELSLYHSRWSV